MLRGPARPNGPKGPRSPGELTPRPIGSVRRGAEVGGTVLATLAAVGFDEASGRLRRGAGRRERSGPIRLRRMLEGLGPTFTKLGQLVAGRHELLPARYRSELSLLRDHVVPLPSGVVLEVVERAYRQPVGEVFASFSVDPVAAASIGQVHTATLPDGRKVAVKVRRPDAHRLINADLAILVASAATLHRLSRRARRLELPALVEEFARSLRDEVDYELEAAHADAIRAKLVAQPWVIVPAMILPLCRPDVLVMEFIEGLPLTDSTRIDLAGIDRRRISGQIIATNLWLILFSDVFHADPHAGNYRVTADQRLAMLDFGQVGHSTAAMRAGLLELLMAIVARDALATARAVGILCGADPVDVESLGGAMAGLIANLTSVPLGEVRIGAALHDLLSALKSQNLSMPAQMTMLTKTVLECESTAEELYPGLGLAEILPVALGLGRPPPAQNEKVAS